MSCEHATDMFQPSGAAMLTLSVEVLQHLIGMGLEVGVQQGLCTQAVLRRGVQDAAEEVHSLIGLGAALPHPLQEGSFFPT